MNVCNTHEIHVTVVSPERPSTAPPSSGRAVA